MSTNITWHEGLSRKERSDLRKQKGCTIWFTGLSASGKSTIATALEQHLLHLGLASYRLDGDNVRFGLNKDLGFSPKDREENIRRIAEVAKLFADSTTITLTSFISPYKADRQIARDLHADTKNTDSPLPFIEVFVDVPIEEAEKRDPKGLYKKARAGEIKEFTGISAPYEAPEKPEIHIHSEKTSVEEAVAIITKYLDEHGPQPQQTEPEAPERGPNHSEIRGYIRANVMTVYSTATGKRIPAALDRHRDNSASQPLVSMSYSSSNKQYAAFVSCNRKTFMNGRPASTMTQALLNLLEASSELMDMFGQGVLQDNDMGVCVLRESGGKYWNGHDSNHDKQVGYRSWGSSDV
ncbi:hypothetical protein AMS68_007366 [Peltaster fructicola]|uniref:Adenylyl-sulfate kinase n=1 Tax=Peltaster fructicola TaxID=286661 RepID=A0A6H0Y4T1_9PEZI|nr:hypothetical protein AMS68_007366 [Peltaster fructicola]